MKYVLVHFGNEEYGRTFVDGFIVPNAKGNKDAVQQIIDEIKIKPVGKRNSEILYSLEHPNERNRKGELLVEVIDVQKPVHSNYWLENVTTGKYLVNTETTETV